MHGDKRIIREGSMADRTIVYWRDIPAQVIVKAGRRNVAKRELSLRFTEAIDMCAMRVGARDTDAYLAEWRKGTPEPCGDDLEAEAEASAAALESEYSKDRLKQLIANAGWSDGKPAA
jgi:Virulence factor